MTRQQYNNISIVHSSNWSKSHFPLAAGGFRGIFGFRSSSSLAGDGKVGSSAVSCVLTSQVREYVVY